MERLTTINEMGIAVLKIPYDCERCGESAYRLHDNGNGEPVQRLAEYENLEDMLKNKYHANVDIKELIVYFIDTIFEGQKHEGFCILTNEDAKKYDEWKKIEEQNRLLKLPCMAGDQVWDIDGGVIEPCTVERIILFDAKDEKGMPEFKMDIRYDRRECLFTATEAWRRDIGEKIFFSQKEAERRLNNEKADNEA